MIDFNNIKSGVAAIVSISSAGMGTAIEFIELNIPVTALDTYLQQIAWIVAILAGLVSVVNGTRKWFRKNGNSKTPG